MRLSENSRQIYADFFCEMGMCAENDFPHVRIYARKGAQFVTGLILVDGITIGRAIYVNPRYLKRLDDGRMTMSKQLLVHEIVHVFQYRKLGIAGFLASYVSGFLKEFRQKDKWNMTTWFEAYLATPEEVEARKYEAKFNEWIETAR